MNVLISTVAVVAGLATIITSLGGGMYFVWTKFSSVETKIDAMGNILLALSYRDEMIDERRVREALEENGFEPVDFLKNGEADRDDDED